MLQLLAAWLLFLAPSALAIVAIGVIGFSIFIKVTTHPFPIINVYDSETTFVAYDLNGKSEIQKFKGSLEDDLRGQKVPRLSVVVPAYNEEQRLPGMLDEAVDFLTNHRCAGCQLDGGNFEIIVVDDGSKDSTTEVALSYAKKLPPQALKVLTLEKNLGKGGAVRRGMLVTTGDYVMFADADGATTFSELHKVWQKLEEITNVVNLFEDEYSFGLVCGSRAHLEEESVACRSLFRTILMYGFHACVKFFGGCDTIKDTQCGFKLMTRDTARAIFYSLHIERWAFDVEMIKIAFNFVAPIPVSEVAVTWTEVDGSKLEPLHASLQMFKDLVFLWARYLLGAWKVKVVRKRS